MCSRSLEEAKTAITTLEAEISASKSTSTRPWWPKLLTPSQIAYRSSKTALDMMMLGWVRALEPDGVKGLDISPGFLATGLDGNGQRLCGKLALGAASRTRVDQVWFAGLRGARRAGSLTRMRCSLGS
ncbi:short-chain dehydrogenase [Stagonosporopsis vannaccii]|nr:short-chain dehydrogenase [Stagonosporopsis vannaccii]